MKRKPQLIASMLRSIAISLAILGATATSVTILAGCGDESQPEYWVKKLEDKTVRIKAADRLAQFFEDAMSKSNGNREAKEVQDLLAKIVGPMTKTYLEGDLDEKTRIKLLKAIAATRDPKAKDAILKVLKDFSAGKSSGDELKEAALYVKALKLKEASPHLLEAFTKLKVSEPKSGGMAYLQVKDAMSAIADPAWKVKLIELINRPLDRSSSEARNEVFWQTIAAELLGDFKDSEAVRPLFKLVVDSNKPEIAPSAVVSLTKIGRNAVPALINIITEKDKEIVEFSKAQPATNEATKGISHIINAAIVLGTIGRAEASVPLSTVLDGSFSDLGKVLVARELTKLPPTQEAYKALQTVFVKVPLSTTVPPGNQFAKSVLAEAAGDFMDSALVPWLISMVKDLKKIPIKEQDDKITIDDVRLSLFTTIFKLMNKDQLEEVKKLVESDGTSFKDNYTKSAEIVTTCGTDAACYASKLDDPALQTSPPTAGLKAAYMAGILGNDATKEEIIKRLPNIKNDAIKFVAMKALDHLSPKGDEKTADALQKYLEQIQGKGNSGTESLLRQFIPRFRARAAQ